MVNLYTHPCYCHLNLDQVIFFDHYTHFAEKLCIVVIGFFPRIWVLVKYKIYSLPIEN